MTGFNQSLIYAVNRLRCVFQDKIGNSMQILGTGFWISYNEFSPVFVTNKHNVDPSLKLGNKTKYQLKKVEIELRKQDQNKDPHKAETKFIEIINISDSLKVHPTADCALIVGAKAQVDCDLFSSSYIENGFASEHDFQNNIRLLDSISFIGFPGRNGKFWYDPKTNLPIARFGHIASVPNVQFSHEAIITSDVLLVSGLSFSGSSGSPVFLNQKGFKGGKGITVTGYVPAMLIGIMSGHWWEEGEDPEMFHHTGLSYFTTIHSIYEIFKSLKPNP